MKKLLFIVILNTLINSSSYSQNVGIGTNAPNPSAALDITDTSRGILIPRMTMNQRNAIQNPAEGLMVYQTDSTKGYWYWDGIFWRLNSASSVTNNTTNNNIYSFTEYVIPNDSSYYWGNAILSTSNFTYNGHHDWRIPSPSELVQLLGKFGNVLPNGNYWSNEAFGNRPPLAMYCDACYETTYYPKILIVGTIDVNNTPIGPYFSVAHPIPHLATGPGGNQINVNPDKCRLVYVR